MVQNLKSNSFPRRYRLTNAKDYRHVFAKPIKSADSAYTILARTNNFNGPRLGVIVSKKNVAKAVQRNRIKRVVRESFRIHRHMISSLDVVVICKKDCVHRLNNQLFQRLLKHWDFISTHAE